jgi:C4-dicarboxylate transporter DctM subunit
MSTLLLVGVFILAIAGAPLFIIFFLSTAVSYRGAEVPMDMTNVFVSMGDLLDKPLLIPIPLFIFSGYLLARSKTPERMVHLAEAVLGWLPGGLAVVGVATMAFLTAFTGASGVTIVALGGLLYPVLLKRKYSERFSLGVITGSGSLGLLFFPSLPIFLFVTIYSLSSSGNPIEPADLFAGGLVPGFLLVALYSAYSVWSGVRMKIDRIPFEPKRVLKALRVALGEVLLPVVIVAFLMSGLVSIAEIATVTVTYVFILEVVVHRDIHPIRDLPRIARESMMLVGAITVILSIILGMNTYLIDTEVPQRILETMQTAIHSKATFLLALNVFLLVVGALMDIFSAIVAVLPLIIPLGQAFGVDPVHLGVVFLVNLEIGYLHPPVGMNLFIAQFHFRKSIGTIVMAILPWLGLMFIGLILVTWVEPITLWLPTALGRKAHVVTTGEPGTGAEAPETSNPLLDALEGKGTGGPGTAAPATAGEDDDGVIVPTGATAAPGSAIPAPPPAPPDDTGEIAPTKPTTAAP